MKAWIAALVAAIVALLNRKPEPPSTPTHNPQPPSPPPIDPNAALDAKLSAAILHYARSQAVFIVGPVFNNPLKGITLHEIDSAAAYVAASLLLQRVGSNDPDLPLCLVAGLIGSESVFDFNCENGNLLGSNKQNDPAGYDVGWCQLKLRYVDPDVNAARAIALDPSRSLARLIDDMREHIAWAADQQDQLGETPEPRARNIYWLAVAAYKEGKTGALTYAKANNFPRNAAGKTKADLVADLENYFSSALSLPKVMGE